jgi:two-component system, sensor histidine kinase and response regulator
MVTSKRVCMSKGRWYFSLVIILTFWMFPQNVRAEEKLKKITLQLKWKHQFQFAGYYMALEKGLYKKAGLDVTILPGGPMVDVVEQVVSKKAEFGVGTSALLLDFAKGKPVVVLGVVYQHSPLVLLMSSNNPTQTLDDIVGKRVMIEHHSADILAMLKISGISADQIAIIPHTGNIDGLINKKTDAITAYITDEPYQLRQQKHQFLTFNPRSYGIDFYGDNFFTRKELFDNNPDLVKKFRKATIEGWKLAISDTENAIKLIYNKYTKRKTMDHLRFEANRTKSLMTKLVSPGHMLKGRWEYILQTYLEIGLLSQKPDLDDFIFVEKSDSKGRNFKMPFWFWPILIGIIFLLLILTAISMYLNRLNMLLTKEISKRKEAEVELKNSNEELTNALNEISTLRGILPICSHCNKIRDEAGSWKQFEQYISSRSSAQFSHGICQDCAKEHYGDVFE